MIFIKKQILIHIKNSILTGIVLLLFAFSITAQEIIERPSPRKNVVKLDLLTPMVGSFTLHYERMIGESFSLNGRGSINTFEVFEADSLLLDIRGYSGQIDIRGYLNQWRYIPEDVYFSFFFQYKRHEMTANPYVFNFRGLGMTTYGVGLTGGKQWLFLNDRLSFELLAGFGFFFKSNQVERAVDAIGGDEGLNLSINDIASEQVDIIQRYFIDGGLKPRIGMTAGFAF